MTSKPIWLRAALNNISLATSSAHHSDDREERWGMFAARLHFVCIMLALVLIGYICGVMHLWAVSSDYCR